MDTLSCHLTVGELKKSLENIPDDTPVYYQRIEDIYFEKHGWTNPKCYKELTFDYHGELSPYIRAFSSYFHEERNVFVINSHY